MGKSDVMKTPIQTLKELGCETLILTNAAGSLVPAVRPGSVMLLTDHINFTGVSPLFGETDSFYKNEGSYFQDITRRRGVAAETRAFTRWGVVFEDFNNNGPDL